MYQNQGYQQQGFQNNNGGGYQPMPQNQSPMAQAVAQGQFPYLNRVELVGMVFPTQFMPQGWAWKDGPVVNGQQKEGHLEINLLVRRAWGGPNPGVSNAKYKIIAYGQLGQQLIQQIGPGAMIRVVGGLKVSNFQIQQGQNAGQWKTSVQIVLKGGRNAEVPFEFLGGLPIPQDVNNNQQRGNGGFNGGGQGGYQNNGNNGGGYQQQPNNNGGGFQQQNNGGYPQNNGGQQNNGYGRPNWQQNNGGGQPNNGQPANNFNNGQFNGQNNGNFNNGGGQPNNGQPNNGFNGQPNGAPVGAPPANGGFAPGAPATGGAAPSGPIANHGGGPGGTFPPPNNGAPAGGYAPQPQQGGQMNGSPAIAEDDIPF